MLNTVLVEGYATLLCLTWSTERGFGCVTFCERQTTCTLKGFTVTRMKGLWWVETVQLVMMTPLIGCFTPFISPLFPFSFSNCSADAEKSESWSPSCTRKNVHQAANSGISLHNRINSHFSVVFHCGVWCSPAAVEGHASLYPPFFPQHFLGETVLMLPEVYRHSYLTQGDLELILRLCLLDPSFPAFVEKVEAELRKLLEEWEIFNNSWRQQSQVSCQALFYFIFFFT